jgi:hypothetical protein
MKYEKNRNLELTEAVLQIASQLTSPNECDMNLEPANVVDGLFAIAPALESVAKAIKEAKEPAG